MRAASVGLCLLLFLAGPLPAFGSGSRVGAMYVELPSGFTPVPTSVARASAQPLVDLLQAAGVPAVGVLRACQHIYGPPQAPLATFTGARIRVGGRAGQPVPELTTEGLERALTRLRGDDPTSEALALRAVTTRAGAATEIGWTQRLADGRTRLVRFLVIPRRAEVAVFTLKVEDTDARRWESTWEGIQTSAALETPRVESALPLWPVLPLALAAAALLAALLHRPQRLVPTKLSPSIVALMGVRPDGMGAPRAGARLESAMQRPLPVREGRAGPERPAAPPLGSAAPRRAADEGASLLDLVKEPAQGEASEGMSLLELKLAKRAAPRT